MYDVIGDVHGHHDALVELLERMDYARRGDYFAHADRTAVFVGDLVDRGPKIPETVDLVRRMVDAGAARICMGNHEFNAIAWQIRDPDHPRRFLRPHDDKKLKQHVETLRQFTSRELDDAVAWFRTIPRWLDLDGIRVVHACWDPPLMERIAEVAPNGEPLSDEFTSDATREGRPLFDAVEVVLKGRELWLPEGSSLADKDGHHRRKVRVRWFESPRDRTYADYAFPATKRCPEVPLDFRGEPVWDGYPADAPPVFFGHYWLTAAPAPLASNVACLDYSVAKGGKLCSYRWDGESTLDAARYVTVDPSSR